MVGVEVGVRVLKMVRVLLSSCHATGTRSDMVLTVSSFAEAVPSQGYFLSRKRSANALLREYGEERENDVDRATSSIRCKQRGWIGAMSKHHRVEDVRVCGGRVSKSTEETWSVSVNEQITSPMPQCTKKTDLVSPTPRANGVDEHPYHIAHPR